MKDSIKAAIGYFFVGVLIVVFFVGFGMLLRWKTDDTSRRAMEHCKQVAEVAGLKEYQTVNDNCVVIKDGKLVEIKND